MNRILNGIMNLHQNRKKGFTLIELVVVIVVLAILIAALAPAILGAIERANVVADQADAKTLMTAANVAADLRGKTAPLNSEITAAMTAPVPTVTAQLFFEGAVCVGVRLVTGKSASPTSITVGDAPATGGRAWPGTAGS